MIRERLAILDAGAQYGKVIDRRVRHLGVESEILPLDTPAELLQGFKAIIISGGPQSVYSAGALRYDPNLFRQLNVPILGICYGMQLMNYALGGEVVKGERREDGQSTIRIDSRSRLFQGLETEQMVLMSHGDSVQKVAEGFRPVADSSGITAAIENSEKNLFGVQFHPEVDLTKNGRLILSNFLFSIAGFSGTFTIEDREQQAIGNIREVVGNRQVLMLLSGGVDSTVCAALLAKGLEPDQVLALHVDTGFMRQAESLGVKLALGKLGLDVKVVEAESDFLTAQTTIGGRMSLPLNEVVDPEMKRKIIGDTFVKVAEREIKGLGLNFKEVVLGQGTLRPDLIESASSVASSRANTIKTHHNDTPLVRGLRERGRVIEPLQEYHKDEVRDLGERLGLPEEIVWRQPFPGPGLAIRTICAARPYITADFDAVNRHLNDFRTDRLAVTLLPFRTVGVQGDERSYKYAVGLSGKINWDSLVTLAQEIPKSVHEVNRVVYLFGGKIARDIREITPTLLNRGTIHQTRQADAVVSQILFERKLLRKQLSQTPVVSFPVGFGETGKRSIGIRPFITNDFMTGIPAVPGKDIPEEMVMEIVTEILERVPGIARVAYDLTSKPPGTIEWE